MRYFKSTTAENSKENNTCHTLPNADFEKEEVL